MINYRRKRRWAAREDALIHEGRAAGKSWDQIAAEIGNISRNCVLERGRELGIGAPLVIAASSPQPAPEPVYVGSSRYYDLTAKSAGHPATWGCISSEPWPGCAP